MSESLAKRNQEPQRFFRFQSLAPGQYWKALEAVEEFKIDKGTVLLIEDIRFIEERMHAVVLRPHPDRFVNVRFPPDSHEFLVEVFLDNFEFEPDGELIRQKEIGDRQKRIEEAQAELAELSTDPEVMARSAKERVVDESPEVLLLERGGLEAIEQNSEIRDVLSGGEEAATLQRLQNAVEFQVKLAEARAAILKEGMEKIQDRMKAVMPFVVEQAELALARTKDVREYAKDLSRGLETLNLFIGKDVVVETIRTGEEAARDVPLTLYQRKLVVEEELSVFETVSESFDFRRLKDFTKALKRYPELVAQICPSPRGVVLMMTLRNGRDYEDAWLNYRMNQENLRAFLLVRNGENVYLVESPITTHERAETLFPSDKEMAEIFESGYFEKRPLTLKDVAYSEHYQRWKSQALHYRRFLVLLAGLDRRLKLFGEFYEERDQSLFVSEWFQKKYMRFVHDADGKGMMPDENRPSFKEWLEGRNRYLRSGSRVMVSFDECLTSKNSPGALWDTNYRTYATNARYTPVKSFGVCVVYRRESRLCIDVEVSGTTNAWNDRKFDCRVDLSVGSHEFGSVICLDRVKVEDLLYYIQNRSERVHFRRYMRTFKAAVKYLREEERKESDLRRKLEKAVFEAGLSDETGARKSVDEAVFLWRAGGRGKELPTFREAVETGIWKTLLDLAWTVLKQDSYPVDKIFQAAEEVGLVPLRLVTDKRGKLQIYTQPAEGLGDRGLFPMVYCWKLPVSVRSKETIRIGKTGLGKIDDGGRWACLFEAVADEIVLKESEDAKKWYRNSLPPCSFEDVSAFYEICDDFVESMSKWFCRNDNESYTEFLATAEAFRLEINCGASRFVKNGSVYFPFGLVYLKKRNRLYFLSVEIDLPEFLFFIAPDEALRKQVENWYVSIYSNTHEARERVRKWTLSSITFSVRCVPALIYDGPPYFFEHEWFDHYWMECREVPFNRGIQDLIDGKGNFRDDQKQVWIHPSVKPTESGEIVLEEFLRTLIESRRKLNEITT